MYDLAIYDAITASPRGRRRGHVYVQDGSIACITDERWQAQRSVEASGLYVLPGMIDGHVHFRIQATPRARTSRLAAPPRRSVASPR